METRYFIMSHTKRLPMIRRRFTITAFTGRTLVPAILAVAALAGCRAQGGKEPPARWKVVDLRTAVQTDSCCPAAAAAGMALLAAGDMAMPGNSLRIAIGCRPATSGIEIASLLELKLFPRTPESETFENARSDFIFDCDDALVSAGASIFELVSEVARIQAISTISDDELCAIVSNRAGPAPFAILMRALEELAVRNNSTCVADVEKLALSSSGDLALRAIGTLGRLKDPRTVLTLGRLTLSDNPVIPWAATQAIADIGGPDAIRALEIIAGQSTTAALASEAASLAKSLRQRDR